MILGKEAKAIAAAMTVCAAFGAGWVIKGKFEDSNDLAAMKETQALAEDLRESLADVSRDVEKQLAGLQPSERIIDRGVVREIQTPVFRNVCISPDSQSFGLLNWIADGKDPGEFAGQGAKDAPETD